MADNGGAQAGVVPDLNDILSGLIRRPEPLLMDPRGTSPKRNEILLIQKSGNRAAAIVHGLNLMVS